MGEHAFPMMGFVCESAHVAFGGSDGIMSTARPELPHPCYSQAKSQVETLRGGSNVTVDINRNIIRVKVAYKQTKPPLVGEHAFPLTGFVCLSRLTLHTNSNKTI